jgi:phage shock protein C
MVQRAAEADAVAMNSTTHHTTPRRFTRSKSDKVISGVAGGLGEYFGVDPVLFRVGIVVATITTGGLAAIAYFALAIARDSEDTGDEPTSPAPTPVAA